MGDIHMGYGRNDDAPPAEATVTSPPKADEVVSEAFERAQVVRVNLFDVYGEVENNGDVYKTLIGRADSWETAEQMAWGRGHRGSNGRIEALYAVRFESGETYILGDRIDEKWKLMLRKKAALAKLTPEEQELLGLK